ncbi:hypothetical protein [Streptomyces sp. NPDC050804]|uniref:hypothetical protein n=1 Tax=Streptomyces sp. NPDC050804 TaxID=3154745 RepID=UPI003427CCE2
MVRRIGAHGVSRVDSLVSPDGRTPMLEISTVPGLTQGSRWSGAPAAMKRRVTPKLRARVRFSSPAPHKSPRPTARGFFVV